MIRLAVCRSATRTAFGLAVCLHDTAMAIIERDNDEAFVGQAEADLGGAQEVYDLQGEGHLSQLPCCTLEAQRLAQY